MTTQDLQKFYREKFIARIAGFFKESRPNYFDKNQIDSVVEYWGGLLTFRNVSLDGAYKGAPVLIQAQLEGDLSTLSFGDLDCHIVTDDSEADVFARCVHKIEAEGRALVQRRVFSNSDKDLVYNLDIRNMGTSLTRAVSYEEFAQFTDEPQLCLIRADLVQLKENRVDQFGNRSKRRLYQLQNFRKVEKPKASVKKDSDK